MNRRTLPFVGVLFFGGAVAQTLACLGGLVPALLCGMLWPPIVLAIFRFFEMNLESGWLTLALPAASVFSGTAIAFFGGLNSFHSAMWSSTLLAVASSGLILMTSHMRRNRCGLCGYQIGRGLAFSCPRCSLLVCEQKCWNFDHSRCALCEQNQVPILPTDGRWWDKRLGPRSALGHCQLCQSSGKDVDLRICGKCGRPHCRGCWDYLNGRCTRCGWVIDDLPETLQPYVVQSNTENAPAVKNRR